MRTSQPFNVASEADRPESFQLKGGLFPMSLLEIKSSELDVIEKELGVKVKQSPEFFRRSAIVIGFEQIPAHACEQLDLHKLHSICRNLELMPAAIRGGTERLAEEAHKLGMAVLPKAKSNSHRTTKTSEVAPEVVVTVEASAEQATTAGTTETGTSEKSHPKAQPEASEDATENSDNTGQPLESNNKVVTTPIRSGQQIYARGGDLIVLTSVSAGAEVLADGNIHIYGPLRGRALAGVQGDETARIFCRSQEAELVSIAGHFLVDEVLRSKHWKEAVQIYIDEGRLITSPLA